jgi:hypothetical protein
MNLFATIWPTFSNLLHLSRLRDVAVISINVFLLLSMYSYYCLCILIVVYVFLLLSMYS